MIAQREVSVDWHNPKSPRIIAVRLKPSNQIDTGFSIKTVEERNILHHCLTCDNHSLGIIGYTKNRKRIHDSAEVENFGIRVIYK